jgi:glycosyltransferase involved in cell wall biosynthesis
MRSLAVGVVLPVHNEAELLPAALEALERAGRQIPDRCGRHTVIVLDACVDRSEAIARRWARRQGRSAVTITVVDARNVGLARGAGAEIVLAHFAGVPARRLWLATTDADSQVPPTWLSAQLAHHDAGAGLWTGRVEVADWSGRTPAAAQRWRAAYDAEARPVHGASMGVDAAAYRAAGGFPPLRTGEDRALRAAVLAIGAVEAHGGPPVVTSARRGARAPLGFAHALSRGDREDHDGDADETEAAAAAGGA